MRKLTEEEISYLKEIAPGRMSVEITELFNIKFEDITVNDCRYYKKLHKIKSGINTRFEKGRVSPQKGVKGVFKRNSTSFKPGSTPHNTASVGAEVVKSGGIVWVKIAQPSTWKRKSYIVWEEVNGPVPKGCRIVHLDRNTENFKLDNLRVVTPQEMALLARTGGLSNDKHLNDVKINIAKLSVTMHEKKRK